MILRWVSEGPLGPAAAPSQASTSELEGGEGEKQRPAAPSRQRGGGRLRGKVGMTGVQRPGEGSGWFSKKYSGLVCDYGE